MSSGDAWEMAENLTRVQNYYANIVRTRKLADVAFGAIHCVAQARGQFFNDVKKCGIDDAVYFSIEELMGLVPNLTLFKASWTGATTMVTHVCLLQAEDKYKQSIQQCGTVP